MGNEQSEIVCEKGQYYTEDFVEFSVPNNVLFKIFKNIAAD